tara:strand:+ start:8737 stop:9150 length:414 start_codon:yes stop_codon:yes gene_type:complete
MQRNLFKIFYLIYLIPSFLFPNKLIAGIGDGYICEDFAGSYYENQSKQTRENYKFFIQWERNTILTKFDNFPNIFIEEIIQQDSKSFIAWQYDEIGGSGISSSHLDETNEKNILFIRTHVDSKSGVTSSWFASCERS